MFLGVLLDREEINPLAVKVYSTVPLSHAIDFFLYRFVICN